MGGGKARLEAEEESLENQVTEKPAHIEARETVASPTEGPSVE